MDSINISDYLTDRNGKNGKCRVCSKAIIWNKQKLGNHKRSGNCIGQSSEERAMFKGLVSSEIHILQSSSRASQAITTSSSPTPAKFVLESSPNGAEVNPLTYWSVYGRTEYPALARIALRVFSCPTSSADSERAWSVFDLIHSKRRKRLVNLRVNKLVFVYMNRAFRGDSENTMFHFE